MRTRSSSGLYFTDTLTNRTKSSCRSAILSGSMKSGRNLSRQHLGITTSDDLKLKPAQGFEESGLVEVALRSCTLGVRQKHIRHARCTGSHGFSRSIQRPRLTFKRQFIHSWSDKVIQPACKMNRNDRANSSQLGHHQIKKRRNNPHGH